jgi:poly(hydroxyalkanoate) depolymerase family esterase
MKATLALLALLVSGCSGDGPSADAALDASPGDGPTVREATAREGGADAAAAGTLDEVTGFGSNPGNLGLWRYRPAALAKPAALVVALHGCTDDARSFASHSGWRELADRKQLLVIFPEQRAANNLALCFNWFEPGDLARGQGEAGSIAEMVEWAKGQHAVDAKRVYVTGLSAGASMAAALAARYPDLFAGAAIMAGVPFGCAQDLASAQSCMKGSDKDAKTWGDLVRAAAPAGSTSVPRVALFQGSADPLVAPSNLGELIEQWTDAQGADATADATAAVGAHSKRTYKRPDGAIAVVAYELKGMGHGMAVDPGSGPTQAGQAGTFYYAVGLASVVEAASVWGL